MYLVVIEVGARTVVQTSTDHRGAERLIEAYKNTEEKDPKKFRAFIYHEGEYEEIN